MALLLEYPVVDIISNYINSDSVYGNIINENDFKSLIVSLGDEVGQYTGPGHYVVLPLNKEPLTGIDIPVLVKRDKQSERPVIAIVAQDPLRSEKDKNLKVFKAAGSAIIGTPFALHYKEDDYPQTIVYRRIIECLLSYRDGYDVYITDAHKTYPRKKGLKRKEEDVLKAEIKKIEPRLVITFGSEAKEYFDKIKEDFEKGGGRVINLLHPGQQNWDHWKQWIFEQAFAEKKRGGSDGFYTGIANSISIRKWMFDDRKMDMPSIITDVIRELVSQTV